MGLLTLVLGGVRSGKSRFAEKLALGANTPVTYVATARPGDAEMTERIARHQRRRESFSTPWMTVEEPWDVAAAVRQSWNDTGCVLLECMTLWVTNLMVGMPPRLALADEVILAQVDAVIDASRMGDGRLIVVSNETGCGIMPINELARRFGDILGEANQNLATAADEVYVCLAGIPLQLKGDETRK